MAIAVKEVKETKEEMYKRLASRGEFTVLDLETTGFMPTKGGYIIEVAAIRISNGKIVDEWSTLVQPPAKIYGKTIEITGITNEMVKGKPTYEQVLPELAAFIGNSVVVAHNAMFDWDRFLLHYFGKLGIYPKNETICTKNFFGFLEPERRKLKLKYGLSELVAFYGVPFDEENHHRALDDTRGTALAFLNMRKAFLGDVFVEKELNEEVTEREGLVEAKKLTEVEVTFVRYWEKAVKGRDFRRVYVNLKHDTMHGKVFYDIPSRSWIVQDSDEPLDLESVEQAVLKRLNQPSIEAYVNSIGKAF